MKAKLTSGENISQTITNSQEAFSNYDNYNYDKAEVSAFF